MITEKIIKDLKNWIKEITEDCKVVIGISGGTDSSVVAKLCVEALGKDKAVGILMPNGHQHDISYSKELVELLGIKSYEINIFDTYKTLTEDICKELTKDKINSNDCYQTNTPARIRMTTLYGVAAMIGNCRVVNTCNLSEDYVGYSTKFGDSAGDFSPLARFTKTEVREIGRLLGLPAKFIDKVPEDGMSGKSDEEKLGFTYESLDTYIRTGTSKSINDFDKIEKLHKMNLHKLLPIPAFDYNP